MNLASKFLTPERRPTIENLFGDTEGPVSRCWCMDWRTGSKYRQRPVQVNKGNFHELARLGPPPGLLAFGGNLPVG